MRLTPAQDTRCCSGRGESTHKIVVGTGDNYIPGEGKAVSVDNGDKARNRLQGLANRGRQAYPAAVNGTGTQRGPIGRQEEDGMDFSSSSEVGSTDTTTAPVTAKKDSKTVDARRFTVVTDSTRDALLTDFGKETLNDRYLLPGEG